MCVLGTAAVCACVVPRHGGYKQRQRMTITAWRYAYPVLSTCGKETALYYSSTGWWSLTYGIFLEQTSLAAFYLYKRSSKTNLNKAWVHIASIFKKCFIIFSSLQIKTTSFTITASDQISFQAFKYLQILIYLENNIKEHNTIETITSVPYK